MRNISLDTQRREISDSLRNEYRIICRVQIFELRGSEYIRIRISEYFHHIFNHFCFTTVVVELESVSPVEGLVTEGALEPGLGVVGPVVTPQLVRPDEAGAAVLVGAGVGPGAHVVAEVGLEVVLLGEGLPTVLNVTDMTV